MSPVEPSGRGHVGRAALVSLVAIVLVFAGLWLVTVTLGKRNSPDLKLGDQTFRVTKDPEGAAREIAERGPLIFSDVSGRKDRDIIVQHLGDDPEEGWYAFDAQPLDRDRGCYWEWQPDEDLFRASCDDGLPAPADGEGLTQYHVTVDGSVVVDLNYDERQQYEAERSGTTEADAGTTTTTDAGTTTTTAG